MVSDTGKNGSGGTQEPPQENNISKGSKGKTSSNPTTSEHASNDGYVIILYFPLVINYTIAWPDVWRFHVIHNTNTFTAFPAPAPTPNKRTLETTETPQTFPLAPKMDTRRRENRQ